MRAPALLCLALAACSSDPCQGANCTFNQVDSGPAAEDRPRDNEAGAPLDTGADVPAVDAGDDRPSAIDAGADAGPADVGAEVFFGELPPIVEDVRDAGVDTGAADAGSDVPAADVRMACGGAMPDLPCRSHSDCAVCIPGALGEPWCCSAGGYCGLSNGACR
jgi:hypothetical protein